MKTLRVLVVDDEALSRRRLKRLISRDSSVQIVGECASADEALRYVGENPVDVVFLDVHMPGMDSFTFLETVGPDRQWSVIFVTAYDNFALKAFDARALDYLLKPYEYDRLCEALRRAKSQVSNINSGQLNPEIRSSPDSVSSALHYRDRLAVRTGEELRLLRIDQVDWIEAADNYVNLHCGNETFTVRETMTALQRALDPWKFLRIHRSAIVNLDRIKALQPWFRGDYRVVLNTGAILTLSRAYRRSLEDRILNH